MKIYPAIDLFEGQCVRLVHGDFQQLTRYSGNPLEVALGFERSGAQYLHVVDLDGARLRRPSQIAIIEDLASQTALKLQVGGGIRTFQEADAYRRAGVDRIVLGSLAVQNPEETLHIIERLGPEHVTLAFDFRYDAQRRLWPAVAAWTETEAVTPEALFAHYSGEEALQYLCTNIGRDGAMQGIEADFYRTLLEASGGRAILASGGVRGRDDIELCRELKLEGAVIGKALYQQSFSLADALRC